MGTALSWPCPVDAPPMNEPTNAVILSYAPQDADASRRIAEARLSGAQSN
jgi:hypothetical protein